jgi:hypothetical protein
LEQLLQKFIRIALIVCLVLVAIPIVVIAALELWVWYKGSQVESYYRERPLLKQMRAREPGGSTDSAPARQAFLGIVPLGTHREGVTAVLRKEGFDCGTMTEAQKRPQTLLRSPTLLGRGFTFSASDSWDEDFVECQAGSPAIVQYTTWIVTLRFDVRGTLSDARVARWNIFL